jgi:hypothetical protein
MGVRTTRRYVLKAGSDVDCTARLRT